MANEGAKSKLDRIKKLAENVIDDISKEYQDDAQYLYTVASSLLQKMALDEEDAIKEAEEDS